jgi:hypothetical protein
LSPLVALMRACTASIPAYGREATPKVCGHTLGRDETTSELMPSTESLAISQRSPLKAKRTWTGGTNSSHETPSSVATFGQAEASKEDVVVA